MDARSSARRRRRSIGMIWRRSRGSPGTQGTVPGGERFLLFMVVRYVLIEIGKPHESEVPLGHAVMRQDRTQEGIRHFAADREWSDRL